MVQLGSPRIGSQSLASSCQCIRYLSGTFKVPGEHDYFSMSVCIICSPWSNTLKMQNWLTNRDSQLKSLYFSCLSKLNLPTPCQSSFLKNCRPVRASEFLNLTPHFTKGNNFCTPGLTRHWLKVAKKISVERELDPTQFLQRLSGEKKSAWQCRRHKRHGFDSWVGKIPWRRKWLSTPGFLPRESHGQRSLEGYSPWSCKELDTTEDKHMHDI